MLNVILYLIALVTGIVAFSGLAGIVGSALMTLFQLSLILLVVSLLTRGFQRHVVWY